MKEEMAQGRSPKEQAKDNFLTYLRTLQFMKTRLKGDQDQFVFVSQREIEKRFFIHPHHNRQRYISELELSGEIEVRNISPVEKHKHARYEYKALRAGAIDLSLLSKPDESLIGNNGRIMRDHLKRVSLADGSPSTPYFDFFLKHKDQFVEHFFTVDKFANRVHTPITNFHRTHRPNILIDGEPAGSMDVTTMQPLILGKVLKERIGVNDFTDWTERGDDIYILIQKYAGLETRDIAKKRFFEILFAPANDDLERMFGNAKWISWINWYKNKYEPYNPHSKEKPYSNLAWLLQTKEVSIMRKVWQSLIEADIPFLSVHDEIIVKQQDLEPSRVIFNGVLAETFKYFNLNSK